MATQTPTRPATDPVERQIQKLRKLYADAPEVGRVALENLIDSLKDGTIAPQEASTSSAGRVGARRGKVSEFTMVIPLAKGGAERFKEILAAGINLQAPDRIGTVHDMRFVFLDDDTRVLFATTYDGEWSPYIDDFATHIPDELDLMFSNCEGWPGVRSPDVKEYIAKYQHTASGWYVASPNVTVKEQWKLEKVGAAVEEFLDKIA